MLLAVLGVLGIVRYFRTEPVRAALEQQLIRGLLMLLLGLFCIFNARWFIATFPVLTMLYGVGLLAVGVAKVQWTVAILCVKVGGWYLPGVSAVVTLVCAVGLLLNLCLPWRVGVNRVALIVEAVVDLLAISWIACAARNTVFTKNDFFPRQRFPPAGGVPSSIVGPKARSFRLTRSLSLCRHCDEATPQRVSDHCRSAFDFRLADSPLARRRPLETFESSLLAVL